MSNTIIDKAWSDISPGDPVRWATPRFIKYGVVLARKGRSITFQCADEPRPVVIPDARWYYFQFKMYGVEAEECLCILRELPAGPSVRTPKLVDDSSDDPMLSVNQACEILGMDPKQLRRYIRRGLVTATKNRDGQWQLQRELLMSLAAKRGWL